MTGHLAPRPWSYMTTAPFGKPDGSGHVYIIDANNRKIGVLWGPAETKMADLQLILDAANGDANDEKLAENDGPSGKDDHDRT